jgi:hypothetical protein
MRRVLACLLLLLPLSVSSGCDRPAAKSEVDASALPGECETFLTQYACSLTKEGRPTFDADQLRATWSAAALQPAARPGISTMCSARLANQAESFKNAGCAR